MRLRRAARRLDPPAEVEVQAPEAEQEPGAADVPSELRQGMRGADLSVHVASDLLAGLLVWMGVGWLLDQWLDTDPWFIVIGALVGYAGGLLLVWRRVQRIDQAEARAGRSMPPPGLRR